MTVFMKTRALFHLPQDVIYLDGNSLGPLPRAVPDRVNEILTREWGEMLITGWNRAGWMRQPARIGDRIAPLVGAPDGTVVIGDTLSIKIYQALAAALELRPERRVILSDTGNFPSDLYMAEGLIASLGHAHELVTVAPEDVAGRIGDDVAVLMLTEVDYRTGRKHDMAALTEAAHRAGALTIWDLAHSAGALPVDLTGTGADFAAGCTYKYLNSGPGGPGFIYIAPHLADQVRPALSGWLGHEAPFDFALDYRPHNGVERMRVGTPPIIQLAALDTALDVWEITDIHAVRTRSIELTEQFIAGVEATCPELVLVSPRDPAQRGSQVSFRHAHGYAVMQALIAQGVIGDFRAPDIIRFGFAPLYIGPEDVARAIEILSNVMTNRLWNDSEYQIRKAVT